MKLIALKIDVDSLAGIQSGVPQLQQLLLARQCGATFFWSLGHEAHGTFLRPGRFQKRWSGTTTLPLRARLGSKAWCRGSLLPSASLTRGAVKAIQSLAQFEHGVRPETIYDWRRDIHSAASAASIEVFKRTLANFTRQTGHAAAGFAAAAWQSNRTIYRREQLLGLRFASDTRGVTPFFPVVDGEPLRCLQLPVTLPMLEELWPEHGANSVELLLAQTQNAPPLGHVFNIAADFDGTQKIAELARLVDGWLAQGYQIISLGDLCQQLDLSEIAYHEVEQRACTGRTGLLATQGRAFPS